MPYKSPADAAACQRRWHSRNRKKHLSAVRAYQQRVNDWLVAEKAKRACRCGEADTDVLDFHHRDAAQKLFNIGNQKSQKLGLPQLQRELAKCDVLCSNCHRREEAKLRREKKIVGSNPTPATPLP